MAFVNDMYIPAEIFFVRKLKRKKKKQPPVLGWSVMEIHRVKCVKCWAKVNGELASRAVRKLQMLKRVIMCQTDSVFNRSVDLRERKHWDHGLWSDMHNSRWAKKKKKCSLVFPYRCKYDGPDNVFKDVSGTLGSSSINGDNLSLKWWKMLEK